jgi:hypothetical protein
VTVLATQTMIDTLSVRIERAYRLRRSSWHRGSMTSKVWSIAASALVQLHQEDPSIPVDPELYVAVQPVGRAFDDPWIVLVQPEAARRYRRRVREMIRGLRTELRGEIRAAERRIGLGEPLRSVLETPGGRMSALGCFIVAMRSGSERLADPFRPEAVAQHRSCPLYRQASLPLLPAEDYPVPERSFDEELVALTRQLSPQSNLN